MSYELLDSGNGRKLERFQNVILSRPCSQALWRPQKSQTFWQKATSSFDRVEKKGWEPQIPEWTLDTHDIQFHLKTTDFGHLGIFPEQRPFWQWIRSTCKASHEQLKRPPKVLNLFAYSGGSTLASALGGAQVCHLDASKGMVDWARKNAALNNLSEAPIRWIIEDVAKFLSRELKRGSRYDGIILDPPSFGRGARGEVFKIEETINELLTQVNNLLSETPCFVLFSCHTPGFTPCTMNQLLQQSSTHDGIIDDGEMILKSDDPKAKNFVIPSGTYALWRAKWTNCL